MKGSYTFTMIKPDAVKANLIGPILNVINQAGFRIAAMQLTRLSIEDARVFYAVHEGKGFYEPLCEFMSSGPIVAAILLKDNAIADFRELIGKTDPAQAAEGTIRKLFAKSLQQNAIHGSDSKEAVAFESSFFFAEREHFEFY